MKVVKEEDIGTPRVAIDYNKLADFYNASQVGAGIETDEEVYNITLFKRALNRRGLKVNEDFSAFNKDGKTFVKRLSEALMTKD